MSELDRLYNERLTKRLAKDRERRERVEAAARFLADFHAGDIAPSKALADHGLAAHFESNRLVIHRTAAGIHADGLAITVGEQGEIDVAGRSLGQYAAADAASSSATSSRRS